jgi:hypothetical protein
MPGVSSSKKRIKPAPPLGIGPSPRFFLRFFAVFGMPLQLLIGQLSPPCVFNPSDVKALLETARFISVTIPSPA